jgi:hypothetical protein
VIATAAVALKVLGRASTIADAEAMAEQLWQARPRLHG